MADGTAQGSRDVAEEVLREHSAMANDRAVFEGHWREIEDFTSYKGRYFQGEQSPGTKSTQRIFDVTAPLAADRFAAACESMITPRTQRWHGLTSANSDLRHVKAVKDWGEEATEVLFSARYAPGANFASQVHEAYWQIGAYGTGCVFVDDLLGRSLLYRAIHLAEIFASEDAAGRIDTVHRAFRPTLRQIAQRFGVMALPDKFRTMLEKAPETRTDVVHCVKPNAERDVRRLDYRGMALSSYYVMAEGRTVLEERGYRTMPYCIGRFSTSPREVYGRGPGMLSLPEIKMLNEMRKAVLRAAQKTIDPPLLLPEDGLLRAFDLRSGSLNYGGVDSQGNAMVKPLMTGARIDIGEEMLDQARKVINDAFLVTLFQILVETPDMTATEAMLRAQEKGQLLAPTMGRVQSEMAGAIIERELDIMSVAGQLPPMPDELLKAGGMVDIEYVSPLNRLQKSEDGIGILRTLEALAPLAQLDPTVVDVVDPEMATRIMAEVNGMPSRALRSEKRVQAMREGRAQQQQMQDALAVAPVAASAAKDLATAQATARQAPGPLPGVGGPAA
jgi:hypothetical protein